MAALKVLLTGVSCLLHSYDEVSTVQDLVAITEEGLRDQASLLKSYVRTMLPVLLLDQQEEQLEALASVLGKSVWTHVSMLYVTCT